MNYWLKKILEKERRGEMFSFLKNIFISNKPFSKEQYYLELSAIALKAGTRPARGNVALQKGAVLSRDNLDKECEAFITKYQ